MHLKDQTSSCYFKTTIFAIPKMHFCLKRLFQQVALDSFEIFQTIQEAAMHNKINRQTDRQAGKQTNRQIHNYGL